MGKALKKNLGLNLIITLSTSILLFILNKYFSNNLGMEKLGLMRLFTQIIAYLNLADMGIGVASSYALYKPISEKDNKKIQIILSTLDFFYKRIALGILLLGLGLNVIIPKILEENIYGNMIYIYWSLYVISTSLSYLYAKYSIFLMANQEYKVVRLIQGLGKIICQIIQILILIKFKSFSAFIIVLIFENIYLYILYKYYYKKNKIGQSVQGIDKSIIKNIKNLFWHKFAGVIVFNTDYIILSKFTTLKIVARYSSYLMIYQAVLMLISLISNVLTPIIGKYVAENSEEKIYKNWKKIYIIYCYIAVFSINVTYYLITPFVKLWLGKDYILEKVTVILILINLFIQMTRGAIEMFKEACGFFDDIYAPFLESGLNILISLVLVLKIGLNGVIIGTLISNIAIIVILKPMLVFSYCFKKEKKEYLKIMGKYLLITVCSIGLINFNVRKIFKLDFNNISNWEAWIYTTIVISTISFIIVTIIFTLTKDFRELLIKK